MDAVEQEKPTYKASNKKTALFFLFLLALILAALFAWYTLKKSIESSTPTTPATSKPQKTDSATDPRLQNDIAPAGGTDPSPSATGPGSQSSIVGQP